MKSSLRSQIRVEYYDPLSYNLNLPTLQRDGQGVDQQKKLINALIAQQNTEMDNQNRKTKSIMDSVRDKMKREQTFSVQFKSLIQENKECLRVFPVFRFLLQTNS